MMNTTLVETKTLEARCGFSAKGAWNKIRQLRAEYGPQELARLTGLSKSTIDNFCSASYMKKHKLRESTWVKYFGEWGLKDPVFPNANQVDQKDAIVEAVEEGKEIMVIVNEENKEPVKEEKPAEEEKVRLILEVPKLEMLEEALKRFGFRMIIE